ncbi:MAG: hypothetical protein J4478_01055 [Candidatus Diapherotrites archaeon]|uniref:Uncharacterized protein n=1 Tax=Candidatus Iainarchaeum sp. TaxID=3101447 RepID=A0A7J4KS50_9ARCH|nr:MAG: hypothetical protein UY52_C0037G0002 [Parcubacteria group bacterium GW2011_GWC2_49_9]MBS3057972.1 hypothetical protein [Candidatus Diapherotrites archaeon]HIH32851.1 hypothetical protein [Candidatus Diapherotrites archaeon]
MESDYRMNGFLIVGFAAWFLGAFTSSYSSIRLLGMSSPAEALASVFFVFVLCLLFFGRFSAFSMFFAGLISGPVFQQNIALGFVSLFAFLLAGFAGTFAGFKLFDDFHGNDNFYSRGNLKQLGLYLAIALILAFIPALFQQQMPSLSAQEVPLKIKELMVGV